MILNTSVLRLLIIDNYDSFTYNLVQIIEQNSLIDFDIVRNDKIDISQINSYEKILISPGPGLPSDIITVCDVIKLYAKSKSILGICLGHEAIAEVFGSKLIQLEEIFHGVRGQHRV